MGILIEQLRMSENNDHSGIIKIFIKPLHNFEVVMKYER